MKVLEQQSLGLAYNRPRRKIKKPTFFAFRGDKGEAGESKYHLVECVKYKDEHHQKWKVYVTTSALLMMQLHCHLLKNEVIGFVAGHNIINERKKRQTLVITETYPCEAAMLDHNHEEREDLERNVELSPESGQDIMSKIEKRN